MSANQLLQKKNGYTMAKVSDIFVKEMLLIKLERVRLGKSKSLVSTEKLTSMILRHKDWEEIRDDLINAEEEEIEKYSNK